MEKRYFIRRGEGQWWTEGNPFGCWGGWQDEPAQHKTREAAEESAIAILKSFSHVTLEIVEMYVKP